MKKRSFKKNNFRKYWIQVFILLALIISLYFGFVYSLIMPLGKGVLLSPPLECANAECTEMKPVIGNNGSEVAYDEARKELRLRIILFGSAAALLILITLLAFIVWMIMSK